MTLVDQDGKPTTPPIKVMIAVPVQDQMSSWTAFDLARLVGFTAVNTENVAIQLNFNAATLLVSQRTSLVRDAIRSGATHILWCDSDMRFPKDALVQLLRHDLDVVGANYPTRRVPVKTVAFADFATPGNPATRVYTHSRSTPLQRVAAVGMGLVLEKTAVYQALSEPWFMIPFDGESYEGEDIYHWKEVAKIDVPVYIDHELSEEVQHMGSFAFEHEMARQQYMLDAEQAASPAEQEQAAPSA